MEFISFFDLKNRAQLDRYFQMKKKHDFEFTIDEQEAFMLECIDHLHQVATFDRIVIPETKNEFLIALAQRLDPHYLLLKKSSVEEVLDGLSKQKMMKAEREKLIESIKSQTVFQINKIAGNQRKRFKENLFKPLTLPPHETVLFLDDAVFGGSTLEAALHALSRAPDMNVVLFSKATSLEMSVASLPKHSFQEDKIETHKVVETEITSVTKARLTF